MTAPNETDNITPETEEIKEELPKIPPVAQKVSRFGNQ